MTQAPVSKSPLRQYQAEAAVLATQVIKQNGGFYIQHPPGAGKSLTAIAVARLLKAQRIAVVCPVVAIGVWKREIARWWPQCGAYDALGWIDVNGNAVPPGVSTALIVNYDRLIDKKNLDKLCEWTPDLLIVDEGQYVKSPSALRTRAIWKLADQSAGVLYLSGTPAHSPEDWWAQYRIIARGHPEFSMNFTQYKSRLIVLGGPNGNWPMKTKEGQLKIRPEAYERVTQAMAHYTHLAPGALDDLEEPVEQEIPFSLTPGESDVYDKMATLLRAELPPDKEVQAEIVLTKLLRLSQISAGHVTTTEGKTYHIGNSREAALMDLLEQHADEKVVIACRFTEDIRRLAVAIQAQGRAFSFIDGSVTGATRTERENWFQQIEEPAVMLLQYQAGGVAITLTTARVLVYYTLDYSVIRYRQMLGRIWRIGQKGRCLVYTLIAEGTQDGLVAGGLKRGFELVDLARILLSKLRDA